jgi:hypothetical protein
MIFLRDKQMALLVRRRLHSVFELGIARDLAADVADDATDPNA